MLTPEQEKEVKDTLSNSILTLRKLLEILPEDKRLELLELIFDGYCIECGSKGAPCYCLRDD